MTTKTTLSITAVKSGKRTFSDSTVLQSLPSGLAEVQFDLALLLRATGLWAALSRQQRRRAKRMTPRLVAVVDPGTRSVTAYKSLPKIAQRRR
ncbi:MULTISPECIES: hypothetical protein [Rhizobium]|uniref:hypothetical protein n=1 Tax=Rhizobium TaxID=379 RepID=UPI001030D9B5|nr:MULTISPECIES: hypothetical protein [Rhizobium]TAZ29770.1 hypothetical protein ELH73_07825 [Rhizobium leguminosarum]TBC57098.1 hypothetical protein ELH32_08260 [Rhizobium ruizarguesonis]TBZ82643.1 hypothetical protein E0H61_13000 [Rhizobium leguminosarum bv. viciae]TBZ89045.1 hypothetical protein E0H56_23515 [Rhizobium leguminosarum bv. viciae]